MLQAMKLAVLAFALSLMPALAETNGTLRIGDTATFQATGFDQGGDTVRAASIHWREIEVPAHLTFTDTSVAHQATVRLDSTPVGGQDQVEDHDVEALPFFHELSHRQSRVAHPK